jgi:pimeloyl-ACP methyl ester carboxylesterase
LEKGEAVVDMTRWKKTLFSAVIVITLLCLIGPLLIPTPSDLNGPTEKELADADSAFVNVAGFDLHYKEMGQGEPVMILMNGFGGNLFTWRKVMEPLSAFGRVIAFDRIGTGLSAHPLPGEWDGQSPYSPYQQPGFVVGLMDALGIESAILIGNSQGGTVAIATALEYPHRVEALILADPAVYTSGGPPTELSWLYATPQLRKLGPIMARQFLGDANEDQLIALAWHDPAKYSEAERNASRKYQAATRRFESLWEYTVANEQSDLPARVKDLFLPVLVIAGDDDRVVPTGEHARLAEEIPNAEYFLIADCGHVPQEEQPEVFLEAVFRFLNSLK